VIHKKGSPSKRLEVRSYFRYENLEGYLSIVLSAAQSLPKPLMS